MDKFFLRQIVAVWAFDSNNEAIWKCRNVGKLRITQDGTTARKKDSSGTTIFQFVTDKSVKISFEVSEWDFDIFTGITGAEKRELNGTDNPYFIEPIFVPYAEIHTLTDTDITNGYVVLDNSPRKNQFNYYEISAHQINSADAIVTNYHQGLAVSKNVFTVDDNKLMLPTDVAAGDIIETVYEYDSYRGIEIVNSEHVIPETWKVRILMLASPVCNTDKISSIWLTARNAMPEVINSLDFNVEDNIPISLELGRNYCGDNKLYEIVTAGVQDGDVPLCTYNNETLQSNNQQTITTLE